MYKLRLLNPVNDDLEGRPNLLSALNDLLLWQLEAVVSGVPQLGGEGVSHSQGLVPVVRSSGGRVWVWEVSLWGKLNTYKGQQS